jgi:hypothetical protein
MTPAAQTAPAQVQPAAGDVGRPKGRRPVLVLWHPLTAICAVQAVLSLTLVWSNTAFTDEAASLWVGRLELGHWLHGTSWPASYGHDILPGSPLLYPPIGALADRVGGLAGARIASLAFMLGATVLLYFVTERLAGPTAAVIASGLWALSEPVIRLAFATADPLAVFLFAIAAWLMQQAGFRRRHGELVAASAAALALASAASYQGILIDPVMIGFAFLIWRPRLGTRQAGQSAVWLAGALAIFLAGTLTLSASWTGFVAAVSGSDSASQQGVLPVLLDVWSYSGLVIVLGLVGAVLSRSLRGTAAGPAGLLGCGTLLWLIVALLTHGTGAIDRKLVYGLWLTAIAAGYGCASLLRWLPDAKKPLAVAVGAVAVGFLALTAWQSASGVYEGWPDARSFIASFRPLAVRSQGLIFVASQEHVAQYYTPQGDNWARWNSDGLTLDPPVRPTVRYYRDALGQANYGLVTLFYSTSFTTGNLPVNALISAKGQQASSHVLTSAGLGSDEPGLSALTAALRGDHSYRLVSSGPYDNANDHGVYVIWRKVTDR